MTELSSEAAPLSPARIDLLKSAVDRQEQMLNACKVVFAELTEHPDSTVAEIATVCLKHLKRSHEVLEAMIDGLNATRH